MKQVTNEVYRTKRKLKLLEEDGIGQLLFAFLFMHLLKSNNNCPIPSSPNSFSFLLVL